MSGDVVRECGTHCREHIFYFDERRLLRRRDHIVEIGGGWKSAANFLEEYRMFGKVKAATR